VTTQATPSMEAWKRPRSSGSARTTIEESAKATATAVSRMSARTGTAVGMGQAVAAPAASPAPPAWAASSLRRWRSVGRTASAGTIGSQNVKMR